MDELEQRGTNIVAAVRSLQAFFEEAAKLLKHGSSLMAASGWSVARSAACNSEGSKSVDWPRYWAPEDAFQFYVDEPDSFRLAYLSIIFDDIKQRGRISVPLVSCGWMSFSQDYQYRSDKFSYRWCRLALAIEDSLEPDGVFRDVTKKKVDSKDPDRVLIARTMALPLLKIANNRDLDELAISPLLADLDQIPASLD